jgi:hypothetical protein
MAVNVQQSIFSAIAEFMVSQPSLQQLADYRISPSLQHRLDELLQRNSEGGLLPDEKQELEKSIRILSVFR